MYLGDGVQVQEDEIGEVAASSFGPSNYWTKINKTKFIMALGGRQLTIAHNNKTDPLLSSLI
jgi:hypothetical protein